MITFATMKEQDSNSPIIHLQQQQLLLRMEYEYEKEEFKRQTGKVLVEVDPKYFRPAEVEQLLGDPTKAKTLLGWNPRKTSFEELVKIMVKHDMKFVKKLHLKASC
mgnify:CR=1 FL=1